MSTITDPRPTAGTRRTLAPAPPAPHRPTAPRRKPSRGTTSGTGAGVTGNVAGRGRLIGRVARRLSLHPGGAGFFAIVAVSLSALGLVYLTQISHVARAGYTLANLQEQQAKVERDNDLLQYRINGERTLARAAELAAGQYKMQPLNPPIGGAPGALSTAPNAVEPTAARGAPQLRFIAIPRPIVAAAAPAQARPTPSLFARVRDRLIGIGTARADGR